MHIVEEFAEELARQYPELHFGDGGQVFLNKLPDIDNMQRDIVCLTQYWGASDFPSPHDEYRIQARIRGHDIDDSLSGYDTAERIWAALHGWLRPIDYQGRLEFIVAAGPPMAIGYDYQDRPEWTVNFMVDCRQDLRHRSYT